MQKVADLIRKIATGISVPEAYKVRERKLPSTYQRAPTPKEPADPNEVFAKPGELVWLVNEKGEWAKAPWKSNVQDLLKKAAEILSKYVWEKTEKGDAKTFT